MPRDLDWPKLRRRLNLAYAKIKDLPFTSENWIIIQAFERWEQQGSINKSMAKEAIEWLETDVRHERQAKEKNDRNIANIDS